MEIFKIFLFITCAMFSLGIVAGNIWPAFSNTQYYQPINAPTNSTNPSGNSTQNSGYIVGSGTYNSELNNMQSTLSNNQNGKADPVTAAIDFLLGSLLFLWNIFYAIVFILPLLLQEFGVPTWISSPIIGIITIYCLYAFAQWKSGRSGVMTE